MKKLCTFCLLLVLFATYWVFAQSVEVIRDYYDNGQIMFEEYYESGRFHGLNRSFYEHGKLMSEEPYFQGRLHGTYKSYYENGQLRKSSDYEYGKIHGWVNEYFENGQARLQKLVKNGKTLRIKRFSQQGELIEDQKLDTNLPSDIAHTNTALKLNLQIELHGALIQALNQLDKLILQNPSQAELYLKRAAVLARNNYTAQATKDFQRANQLEPGIMEQFMAPQTEIHKQARLGPMGMETRARPTVKKIIERHAVRTKVKNPQGLGKIYLIGQVHYDHFSFKNERYVGSEQAHNLPKIQSEIFHLLKDLSQEANLKLVIDEGLRNRELFVNFKSLNLGNQEALVYQHLILSPQFTENFFKGHPMFSAATVLECFFPKLMRTFGINDYAEVQELKEIIEVMPNPQKFMELTNKRSRMYMDQGIARANQLGYDDLAIVIGFAHLPLMVDEYQGERQLHVIKPKALVQEYQSRNPFFYMQTHAEAVELYEQGAIPEAIEKLAQAIAFDPDGQEAYLLRGSLFAQQGKTLKALEDINTVLEINPQSQQAIIQKGILEYRKKLQRL